MGDSTNVKCFTVENDVPKVTCSRCERVANCIRVSDGTVYKPTAWQYPDKAKPFEGVCGGCQDTAADRFNAMGYFVL